MARYNRERDYYEAVCNLCATQCRSLLASRGLRALVTSRSKEPSSLEQKLRRKLPEGSSEDADSVYRRIVDMAGVRIAIYFPGNLTEVENLIRENFHVQERRQYPAESSQDKPFFGYAAVHYHVRLKRGNLGDPEGRYSDALVEIQIASVVMHAWAEVEHDLAYKPSTGELSIDEREILDQLNALAIASEAALKLLQQALERRVKSADMQFKNHYDMAAYLYDELKSRATPGAAEPRMGRVDVLFQFLRLATLDSPKHLGKLIDGLDDSPKANTIAQQIVDRILAGGEVESALALYKKARSVAEGRLPGRLFIVSPSESAPGSADFVLLWSEFERQLRGWAQRRGYDADSHRFRVRQALDEFTGGHEELARELECARRLRNEVVHGVEQPDAERLGRATPAVNEALRLLDQEKGEDC